jgi:hypothetical protein
MRRLAAGVLAVALLALVSPASAGSSGTSLYKGKTKYRAFRPIQEHRAVRSDWENPYYEHLPDKLPIGTSRWFDERRREKG